MHKAFKGAVVGAVVGGGVAAVWARRAGTDSDDVLAEVAKGAAEGAVVGGLVGVALQWRGSRRVAGVGRPRRKRGMARLTAFPVAVADRALGAASAALPHVEELADKAAEAFFELADAPRPSIEALADTAREKAFDLAEIAIEAARPQAEAAALVARSRATDAAEAARELAASARR